VEVQRRLHFPLSVVTTPAGRKPDYRAPKRADKVA
jgi:hypothetical protein